MTIEMGVSDKEERQVSEKTDQGWPFLVSNERFTIVGRHS